MRFITHTLLYLPNSTQSTRYSLLTEALGSSMALTNVFASSVVLRMVSVLPNLNILVEALSYMAASRPYILCEEGRGGEGRGGEGRGGEGRGGEGRGGEGRNWRMRNCMEKEKGGWEKGAETQYLPIVGEEDSVLYETIRRELHGFWETFAVFIEREHIQIHITRQPGVW